MKKLDQERIEKLTREILQPIRSNYLRGPVSRDRVFEALNALAVATAFVIHGAHDSEALEFFSSALNMHLNDLEKGP